MVCCVAKLTAKQERFVAEYLVDLNAAAAAVRAGYTAHRSDSAGSQLMRNTGVKAAIKAARAKIDEKLEKTAVDIRKALDNQGFYDPRGFYKKNHTLKLPHELTLEQAQVVTKVLTEVVDGKVTIVGYEFANRQSALALAGKDRGMFKDRKEIEHKVPTKRVVLVMDDDE
jgi:phage terminase small subunit